MHHCQVTWIFYIISHSLMIAHDTPAFTLRTKDEVSLVSQKYYQYLRTQHYQYLQTQQAQQ